MIELNLLRYAQAAAETGSFSQAASRFGIKQSTLSQGIQYLEDRLGVPLFTRSTRGVTLTKPGTQILDRARRIIGDVDGLLIVSQSIATGRSGVLRIGFNGSAAQGPLATILHGFRVRLPQAAIEAREASRGELLTALESGSLDLVFAARSMSPTTLRVLGLWHEPLTAALAADHPLQNISTLSWADLRNARFVISQRDPGPDIAAMITARLAAIGAAPSISRQAVSPDSLLAFAAGAQVAVTAGQFPSPGENFVTREIHDAFGPATIEQCLYWRVAPDNPLLKRFLGLAAAQFGKALD